MHNKCHSIFERIRKVRIANFTKNKNEFQITYKNGIFTIYRVGQNFVICIQLLVPFVQTSFLQLNNLFWF